MGTAAAIIATLELNKGKFRTQKEETERDLEMLGATVKETAAAVAVLERELANDKGNKALKENLKTLKDSYRDARREMTLLEKQQRDLNNALGNNPQPRAGGRGPGGEHGSTGSNRMADMEVGHSVRSITDMMSAGQNMGQALQMELPRMLQAAGKGIGAMIGIEVGVAIAKAIETAIQAKRVAAEAFGKLLSGEGGGTGTSSANAIKTQIEELGKAKDEMLDSTGNGKAGNDGNVFSWLKRTGQNAVRKMVDANAPTVEQEADDKMESLDQRRIELSNELVRRKAEGVALDKRAATEGEAAVAVDRERLAFKEKRAAILEDKNLDGTAQAKLIEQLQEESQLREDHIRQVQAQKAAEDEARHGNTEDRLKGTDSAVSKAQRALKEAQEKWAALAQAPGTPEYQAAQDDVDNKKADLRNTKQQAVVHEAERTDAGAEAAMTGTQAQKDRKRLEDERARLQAELDPASTKYQINGEKREDIRQQQLPQVEAQLRALARADQQRAFARRESEIKSMSGGSTPERLAAIDASLSLNQDRQGDNSANEKDKNVSAELKAQAAQLRRDKREIEVSSARELALSIAATREMQLQQTGQANAARQVAIRAQYEERIAAAMRDGKTDLAAQLQLQQKMALAGAAVAEFRKTPAQRAQDALDAQKDQRDLMGAEAKRRHNLETSRRNYEENHRASLPLNATARKAAIEAAVPDTGSLYDGSTRAREAAGNAPDASWDQRFHHAPLPQPDRRPVATADPQGKASTGAAVDSPGIIAAINNPAWVGKLSFANK